MALEVRGGQALEVEEDPRHVEHHSPTFTVHPECPLLLVKAMLVIPDSTQAVVLSFRHVNLASHTKFSWLFTQHKNFWVMLTYVSKTSAGGGPHFTLAQDALMKGLLATFGRGCECTTQTDWRALKDAEEFVTWIRAKRACDFGHLVHLQWGGPGRL